MGGLCRYHITMMVTTEEENAIRAFYRRKKWTCLMNVLTDETVANIYQSGLDEIFPSLTAAGVDFYSKPTDFKEIKTEVEYEETDENEANTSDDDDEDDDDEMSTETGNVEESYNEDRTDSGSETDTAEETGTASESDIDNETIVRRNHKCSTCGMMFSSRPGLKNHEKSHRSNLPHRGSGNMNDQEKHFKDREMRNVCSKCGKTFKYKRNLITHERAHAGSLPFTCCGLGFPSSRSLTRHRCTVHGEAKHYTCKKCGKVFATQSDLTSHVDREEGRNSLCCDVCGHHTSRKCDLMEHMRTHNRERTNVCPTCGAKFKHLSSMFRHVRRQHKNNLLAYSELQSVEDNGTVS